MPPICIASILKMRVDQLSQYLTSVHGKRLKQGDSKVAACVDCHGVHNILPVSDTRSPVYPANVAATCAHCHSDPVYMKGYGIPTDQAARYQKSVHAEMLAQGDTVLSNLYAPATETMAPRRPE